MRLASRFGYANQIRRDRPLTHEELMHYVPGIVLPVSRHHLSDTAHPVTGPALQPYAE